MLNTLLLTPGMELLAGAALLIFGMFLAYLGKPLKPDLGMARNARLMILLTILGIAAVVALLAFALAWRL